MPTKYGIPTLSRAIKIIELLSTSENGLTLNEIETALHIPKTTAFRILRTLQSEEWVEKELDCFSTGQRMIQFGLLALSKIELKKLAPPHLDKLSKLTGETSHMGVLYNNQVLIVDVCEGPKHIKISSRPGSLVAAHCSSLGKILLSAMNEDNLDLFANSCRFSKLTQNTITELEKLKKELDLVRSQGYSVDNMEYFDNVRCIAAPVRNAGGEIIAAIGVTAVTVSLKKNMVPSVAKVVKQIATEFSKEMGYGLSR
jgi:DNA-binding IclR family transcriptional regulator